VFRGPAASLYGGGGSGGVIAIMDEHAPASPLAGGTGVTVGSNNFMKGSGEVGGTAGDATYGLSLSRTTGDGYRTHSHFHGDIVRLRGTYTPSATITLTPLLGWSNVYHENAEGITLDQWKADPTQANSDAVPFNEYLENQRFTAGLAGVIITGRDQELQFSGYAKRTTFTEANNGTFNHRTLVTPGLTLQYVLKRGAPGDPLSGALAAGADLQWQAIDERRMDNLHSVEGDTVRSDERITQRGTGLFLIGKLGVGSAWGAEVSVRYDAMYNALRDRLADPVDLSGSADFAKATARLGVTFSPSRATNVYADWGQGFLPPATEELAQNPDHFGGFNSHLTFATSSGVDLGIRGSVQDRWYYDVAGFYLTTDNDFDRYRITDPLRIQETFYRNIGSSRRFGAEVYTRWNPVEALECQAAYTWSDFRYTSTSPDPVLMDDPDVRKFVVSGNLLPNSPRHQLVVDLEVRPVPEVSLGFTTETLSKAYIDGANIEAEAVPGYTLLHARVVWSVQMAGIRGAISLQGRNLANTTYVAFSEPDPGGNAYQPGPGREFFAGFRVGL
jgi:iron complex outermembrane receptor protein